MITSWVTSGRPRQFLAMKLHRRCSTLFYLLVPGGKWQTEISRLERPPMRADCDGHRLVLRLAVALFGVGSGLDEREGVDGHDLVGFVQERNSDRRVGC